MGRPPVEAVHVKLTCWPETGVATRLVGIEGRASVVAEAMADIVETYAASVAVTL
jgi:hypothetical protein